MTFRVVSWLLCVCLCSWVTQARADQAADEAEAERLFKAGVSLQKAEDFNAAAAAFESSLRLHPTKSAVFNLANCLQALHRYPEALSTLERLEREYASELEEPMRGHVAIQRAELENLTASLSVEAPEGAEVRIDGKPVGTAPLPAPVRVSLGDHEIEVSLSGHATERRSVNLAPREAAVQRFELAPPAVVPEVTPAPAPPAPAESAGPAPGLKDTGASGGDERSAGRLVGWVLAGTGGALLVAGAATGIHALSLDGKLSDDCWEQHCHTSKQGQIDRLDRAVLASNVLLGLGVASAATGVALLLTSDAEEPSEGYTGVGISVTPGYVGAGFRKAFW